MWKNFLSSIGVGGVKIDTVLHKTKFKKGDKVEGKVLIKGGQAAEPVDAVTLTLYLHYEEVREDSDFAYREKDMKEMTIPINRNVMPEEKVLIPFSIELNREHPSTNAKNKTFLKTTVVIPRAVDPSDQDELIILTEEKK
ncbi:hypothetical protein F9802_18220 [Bacillus aerolatus]|uniref:Sporulation protein n=1 Tax=Bacillus aerolatus TaxID=2653354 RepID=A0A6I1FFE9_9BACI|nr:sporulation protein [Bacillus aerolatus]KAB7704227.1 hypothetical protein F9802_18220 [Bacillus aerolatus]